MKYLAVIAAILVLATNAFAELTETEKLLNLKAAREKMEAARAEFEEARKELNVNISIELEMAREALDAAAETLAKIHIRDLDVGPDKVLEFNSDHHMEFNGGPQLGLVIGKDDKQGGVTLIGVTPGSGAQSAGLAAGDRVIEINGLQLGGLKGEQAVERLVGELESLEDGDIVNLVYESDGKTVKADVTASMSKNSMWSFLGELGNIDVDMDFDIEFLDDIKMGALHQPELELSDIDAVMGHYFGVKKGVLVITDSRDQNGFLPGDIIKNINGNDVESTKDVLEQLAENREDLHTVKVLRKGRNKKLDIAGIEETHMFSRSSFFKTSDEKFGNNIEVILRRIGAPSPEGKKAPRILIERKVIEAN